MVSESEEVSVEFPSHPPPPTAAAARTSSDVVSEKQIPVRKTQRRSKNKKEDKVRCEVCGKLYSEITENLKYGSNAAREVVIIGLIQNAMD